MIRLRTVAIFYVDVLTSTPMVAQRVKEPQENRLTAFTLTIIQTAVIPIQDAAAAAQAKYEIERALLNAVEWQLFTPDGLLAVLTRSQFEFSVEWGKLIFAWWDNARSQSWRVTAYLSEEAELRFQVTHGLGRDATWLTLRDESRWRAAQATAQLSRAEQRGDYATLLRQLLCQHFPALRVLRETTGADRIRAVPGRYARLVLQRGRERILAVGVADAETQADVEGVIAAGLVWLTSFNETQTDRERAQRLWLCFPAARGQTILERLSLLTVEPLGARIECFAVNENDETLSAVLPVAQGELLNAHPREVRWPEVVTTDAYWRERILRLAPALIEVRQRPDRRGESFVLHGLEFAHVTASDPPRIRFGVAGARPEQVNAGLTTLTEQTWSELAQLVAEMMRFRAPDSVERRHLFYRLRAEAWLESLLRRNITVLDATLDERFVYSQIPAWRGEERSVIDLLTVNHEGRLVVIEIKAAEDAQLPLQGLDYWLRVEQARLRGEFQRRGLFGGLALAEKPPLLYLVAPRLRFHRTFAMVAHCLSPQIEAYQIGVNSNWRAGVCVRSHERVNQDLT